MKREEIRNIEQTLAVVNNTRTDEDRLKAIKGFKEGWNTEEICKKELIRLALEIIDRIEVNREDDTVEIKINFL
jgi:site-specific DNA recombinase